MVQYFMSGLVKGVMLTLRYMGFSVLLKEVLRRIFGIKYHYRGILVDSIATFRLIRCILLAGYDVYSFGNEIIIHTPFGKFGVDVADIDLLRVLSEPLEDTYGFIDVKDAVVVDVGAYIGETALLFLSKGAYRVYTLEPVDRHYHYLLKNIYRNNAGDRIIPLNYGAWFRETFFSASYEGAGTGLRVATEASVTIRVKHLGDVLREIFRREGRIDLVKMDCEGCEYSLLNLSTEDIRLAKQYIIEIHGSENPIIYKMAECNYKHKLIRNLANLITVHYFTQ